jgi:hypothetical protein
MRPALLRPPFFFTEPVRLFSGLPFVTSSKVEVVMKRRLGVVGRYFLIGTSDHLPTRSCALAAKSKPG